MRQRAPVSYKPNDMNQAKTPSWLVRLRVPRSAMLPDISRARGVHFLLGARDAPLRRPFPPRVARAKTSINAPEPLARAKPPPAEGEGCTQVKTMSTLLALRGAEKKETTKEAPGEARGEARPTTRVRDDEGKRREVLRKAAKARDETAKEAAAAKAAKRLSSNEKRRKARGFHSRG